MNSATVQSAIVSILQANNTTTSSFDLSSGITPRIDNANIYARALKDNVQEFPAIFVWRAGKSEEYAALGRNTRRDISIDFTIAAVTQYADSATSAQNQNMTLADNVETILRNYIDLSQTVDESNIGSTEDNFDSLDTAYCYTTKITLNTKSYTRA